MHIIVLAAHDKAEWHIETQGVRDVFLNEGK